MQKSKNKPEFFSGYNLLATFFGIGKVPFIPGSFGSLAAVIIWFLFNQSFLYFRVPLPLIYLSWAALLTLLYFAGADAADLYSKKTKSKDSSAIVIDEFLGQLTTLLLSYYFVASYIIPNGLVDFNALGLYLLTSFILFRIFDIAKPSFIGVVDKKFKSGHGVMMDDLLAGIVSALIIGLVVICYQNNISK